MAIYTVSVQSIAAAANAPYALISAPSKRMRILQIGVFNNAATASNIGVGRPANTPVGTGIVLGQAQDPSDAAATGGIHTTWTTAPTAPSIYMRRIATPATVSAGIVWVWDDRRPLILAVGGFLTLFNYGAAIGSVLNTDITFDE